MEKPGPGSAPRFPLGRLVATAPAALELQEQEMTEGIRRHERGDWGNVCREDWQANERALQEGTRLLSSYKSSSGRTFWIITEHDRSATTILFPEDY